MYASALDHVVSINAANGSTLPAMNISHQTWRGSNPPAKLFLLNLTYPSGTTLGGIFGLVLAEFLRKVKYDNVREVHRLYVLVLQEL